MSEILELPLPLIIEPSEAHRLKMNEAALWELADSIRQIGLLNPIIVHPTETGQYEIIAGHRRYMAHQMLDKTTIQCIVRHTDAQDVEDARFAENLQREQLTPMEEAVAVSRYMERTGKDTRQTARALNRSEWWVAHRCELLHMPDELQELVHTEELPAGSALEIARVEDHAHRRYLTDFARRSGATVSVVREWVNAWEMAKLANPDADGPKPEMPIEGQEVIITIPCFLCGSAHDHRKLQIVRVCRACLKTVQSHSHEET